VGCDQRTFFQILETRAREHPDREVFADAKERITYGELKSRIEKCAAFLRRVGIGRGDVVTIQLPNRIAFPVVFFALELVGAIANKVNPDFRVRELDYILRFSGSRAFIFPAEFKGFDYVGMAKELKSAIPQLEHLIVAGGSADGAWSLDEGIANSAPMRVSDRVAMDPNEIFRMAFTSGTTGDPKCVLHSFNTTICAVRLINDDMKVTDRDVMLVYLRRAQLGLPLLAADHHRRRPGGPAREVLGARGSRAIQRSVSYIATARPRSWRC
jgi:acyl-CoA synthetase (AMP-forming)/AMP-acid ligase II